MVEKKIAKKIDNYFEELNSLKKNELWLFLEICKKYKITINKNKKNVEFITDSGSSASMFSYWIKKIFCKQDFDIVVGDDGLEKKYKVKLSVSVFKNKYIVDFLVNDMKENFVCLEFSHTNLTKNVQLEGLCFEDIYSLNNRQIVLASKKIVKLFYNLCKEKNISSNLYENDNQRKDWAEFYQENLENLYNLYNLIILVDSKNSGYRRDKDYFVKLETRKDFGKLLVKKDILLNGFCKMYQELEINDGFVEKVFIKNGQGKFWDKVKNTLSNIFN